MGTSRVIPNPHQTTTLGVTGTHKDNDLHCTSVAQPISWVICPPAIPGEALLKVLPVMRHCLCPRELPSVGTKTTSRETVGKNINQGHKAGQC